MRCLVVIPVEVDASNASEQLDIYVPAVQEAKRLLASSTNPCAYDVPGLNVVWDEKI